jgi:carboxypeptidase Q
VSTLRRLVATMLLLGTVTLAPDAQAPVDPATVGLIRQEAMQRSQVMDHAWWLSEVYGPRVSGTPAFAAASEWAMKRFTDWGLANVHQERFRYGQGWVIEKFSARLVEPQPQVLIGAPRAFSRSTSGAVTADVVRLAVESEADLAKYAGKLRGKIVVVQPTRAVRMLDGRIVLRMTEADFEEAAHTPIPAPAEPPSAAADAARALTQKINAFLVAEGAAALLDRGSDSDLSAGGSDLSWQTQRVDGGTIFPGGGGSPDPNAPPQVPSATLAVEHYNRIVRLLARDIPVKIELDIQTTFHPETDQPNGINTLAEIPGTDRAHEVVLLGAHMDGVPYAIGATDNATGSAAMMEALRVIKTLGLKPRRTIRVALWCAEEQGLRGSRAYVQEHYFDFASGTPKPGHETLSAYFNLDNGTGRIRGIWSQSNLAAIPIFKAWGASLEDLGWRLVSPRSVSATDHSSFDNAGLPGFQFMQERLEYNSRSHHSNMDTYDRIQREDLIQQATVAAVFAWHAANWPEKLPRKPLPARKGTAQ